MNELRCDACKEGDHPHCKGDFSPTPPFVTCLCRWCKDHIDKHGPFSTPKFETVA